MYLSVVEKRIRWQVSIDNMKLGFMAGNGKLYYAFVDLEKAFDRVPREVVRLALRKLDVSGSSAQLWHCIQRLAL